MNSAADDSADLPDLDPIEAAATAWLSRRDRGLTPTEAEEFARWRSADPRHEAAVEELGAMWIALDDLSALRGAPPPAAAAPVEKKKSDEARGVIRFPLWAWAAAACLALMLGVLAWQRFGALAPAPDHYETAIGDRRTIALPDGSTLVLNTRSAAEVRYTAGERHVELVRGEAFFSVAKDAARPFVVAAGGVESRALGTAFVVRRGERDTELVVTEGRVKFGTVEVSARHRAVGDGRSALRVEPLDDAALARRVAWQSGRVVFRTDMPLAEAAAEFNRYHRTQLVLRDAATAAVPVGGAFETANLEAFVRSLETSFNIAVVERGADRIVLQAKR